MKRTILFACALLSCALTACKKQEEAASPSLASQQQPVGQPPLVEDRKTEAPESSWTIHTWLKDGESAVADGTNWGLIRSGLVREADFTLKISADRPDTSAPDTLLITTQWQNLENFWARDEKLPIIVVAGVGPEVKMEIERLRKEDKPVTAIFAPGSAPTYAEGIEAGVMAASIIGGKPVLDISPVVLE